MGEGLRVGLLAAGLAVACGSSSGGSGGDVSSACQNYINTAEQPPCATGPQLPASEVSSQEARYLPVCEALFALPGITVTPAQLDACASTIQAAGCSEDQSEISECIFTGSLPAGSACNSGYQCKGGICTIDAAVSDCGTCAATASEGESCSGGATICVVGTECDNGTCTKLTVGSAGAACDNLAAVCSSGACNLQTHTCPAYQEPLQAGADCTSDSQCASGLGCDTSSQKCASVTWASAGQPCGNLVRCLVDYCPGTSGTCPTIIPDGQPCSVASTTSVCDDFSTCVNGTCVLELSAVCK